MFDSVVRSAATSPTPSEVDDAALVELIRAWERLTSWAAAGQLAAIAELARRRPRDLLERPGGQVDAGHRGLPEISEFAVDEIAAALRLSRPAAGMRLVAAVELTRLPGTASALREGVLDVPKVRAVVEAVGVLDDATAVAVEQRVLPRAARQTVGQLRSSLARAVLAADPAAAEQRHERAVARREVTVRPLRDGMSELWALLPADAAAAVYARISRIARAAPADDPRGMDARRADALVTTVLTAGLPPVDAAGNSATTAAGGARAGAASAAGASAATATVTTRAGAGAASAAGAAVTAGAGEVRPGSDAADVALSAEGRWETSLRAVIHVTVPASTVVGLADAPGDLAGHGPIPASMARRLADRRTWRRVTLDPVTGAVTDVGRTAYTPSAVLADLVRARDRTCRFPGCRQPAGRCDLDHIVPWPAGPTTADNLAALCRHHHRLKHQARWAVRAGPHGELAWTTPTGHVYRTMPATE